MRLLAIDESSKACGIAYFTAGERPDWTRIITAPDRLSWRHRMRVITQTLRLLIKSAELEPEVVAIEDAVVARPKIHTTLRTDDGVLFDVEAPISTANPMTGVKMGECRGWLMAHLDSIWPDTKIVSITPAKVRAAAGLSAFAKREESKARYRLVAEAMLPGRLMAEDECDAVVIGLAAFARLKEERWIDMARTELVRR